MLYICLSNSIAHLSPYMLYICLSNSIVHLSPYMLRICPSLLYISPYMLYIYLSISIVHLSQAITYDRLIKQCENKQWEMKQCGKDTFALIPSWQWPWLCSALSVNHKQWPGHSLVADAFWESVPEKRSSSASWAAAAELLVIRKSSPSSSSSASNRLLTGLQP